MWAKSAEQFLARNSQLASAMRVYRRVRNATTNALPARTLAIARHCVSSDRTVVTATYTANAGPSVGRRCISAKALRT